MFKATKLIHLRSEWMKSWCRGKIKIKMYTFSEDVVLSSPFPLYSSLSSLSLAFSVDLISSILLSIIFVDSLNKFSSMLQMKSLMLLVFLRTKKMRLYIFSYGLVFAWPFNVYGRGLWVQCRWLAVQKFRIISCHIYMYMHYSFNFYIDNTTVKIIRVINNT